MADNEKVATKSYASEEGGVLAPVRPEGWIYKSPKIAGKSLPWYASPPVQLFMVALVCFLCPGMFNALNGLGGGGQVDADDNNNAQVALYSTFSVVGFFAGTFANRLGLKLTLSFGGFGYFIYASSLLCYNHTQNEGFLIFAGTLLGVCAGLLWCAQGAIMMAYPPEHAKGRYISWFWMIFNLGAVIGSLIPLGQNIHSESNSVNDGTYIGFMVLMFLGAVLAWFLVDSKHVQRRDGSKVIVMKNPTWQSEILALGECLRTDWYIVALFPMFFASNWFYTYQFNDVNLAKFNIRTRALNNTLYWLSQIVGAFVFGYALDMHTIRRSIRAKAALGSLFVITMAIWGGGYAWQRKYTRAETELETYVKDDWTTRGYVGPMFLFMFYGFYDAAWQTCVYWFMGALTNNGRKTAHFAAFYKGIQSAGAAVIYRVDTIGVPFMNIFASCWALLAGSLIIAAPVIIWKVHDHCSVEEDLKFSDETFEEVAATSELPAAARATAPTTTTTGTDVKETTATTTTGAETPNTSSTTGGEKI
ncbi:MAG: hypothetical protein M1837_002610 [Sclerophora amabilis]|nr:MAG: hypothetical protein M1837_002610 [Sclerophora amabilis]